MIELLTPVAMAGKAVVEREEILRSCRKTSGYHHFPDGSPIRIVKNVRCSAYGALCGAEPSIPSFEPSGACSGAAAEPLALPRNFAGRAIMTS
jgi:hypothetical protein